MHLKTILIVEDNADDAELTMRAIRKNGVSGEIVLARDGVEALDYLFGQGDYAGRDLQRMPAVILLDLKMPRLDGFGVLEGLRADKRTRLLPVVILSSSREDRDLVQSYGLGANSYIVKPVDFGQFLETVGHLGLYWLTLNEPAPVPHVGSSE